MVTRALVLGGANCVWDDMARAESMSDWDMIVAVNDAGAVHQGHVDHWASLHPEKMPQWVRRRRALGLPPVSQFWFHRAVGREITRETSESYRILPDRGGSSGMMGALVALECGADRVVLCGVPMDPDKAHFFDQRSWRMGLQYRRGWEQNFEMLSGRVRSMSGWTSRLLGEPDSVWFNCNDLHSVGTDRESTSGAQGSTGHA